MPTVKKRVDFYNTEDGIQTAQKLRLMAADNMYHTESSYSTDGTTYTDNLIPFVDKHMKYLSEHQAVNLEHYLSNLRLMTRVK